MLGNIVLVEEIFSFIDLMEENSSFINFLMGIYF